MLFDNNTNKLAVDLLSFCQEKNLKIATAESCTGGLISGLLTEFSGSSAVVDRGFVTYSNEAKTEMLDVDPSLIIKHGAVSEEVAQSMSVGALKHSNADLTVAVTGVAGPGQSENKPAGLVYISIASKKLEAPIVTKNNFEGDRQDVRLGTINTALFLALSAAQNFK